MARKLSGLLALAVLAVAGCATAPPVAVSTPYDPAAHAHYAAAGSGSIKGQGFLRQQGGGVVTCAGSQVMLFPATPYFREAIGILRSGRGVLPLTYAAQQLRKLATCDAQGNFQFGSVASGNWFVATEVKWTVGYNPQGGALLAEISVSDHQETTILMSDAHFVGR